MGLELAFVTEPTKRIPVCFGRSMLDEIAILVTTYVRTYDHFNS